MNEKQDVILPWVELQDLLFYFHTIGDEKAEAMLRGLKPATLTPVQSPVVPSMETRATVINRGDFPMDRGSRFLCTKCHYEWFQSESLTCPMCYPNPIAEVLPRVKLGDEIFTLPVKDTARVNAEDAGSKWVPGTKVMHESSYDALRVIYKYFMICVSEHLQKASMIPDFPAVDDLTEMIDHWKENTDMDTHDLVEGILDYFRTKACARSSDSEAPVAWVWRYLDILHVSESKPDWIDDPNKAKFNVTEVYPVFRLAHGYREPSDKGGV